MFRTRYLDYAELTAQLQEWARAHPGLVRLTALGKSGEGRDIPLVTIGPRPAEARPAIWVDGNMHASEVCGSSVALAIAEDVIAIHRGEPPAYLKLPAHMAEAIRESLFYVVPRISPDGAEAVLKTGRYLRSSPAGHRRRRERAYWEWFDFDGDGEVSFMRQASDDGELVALEGHPHVMVPRLPEDPPPYYKLYPEGRIVNFDGRRIPDPSYLSDNPNDFNRNFPYSWAPEHEQQGAGDYPGSIPETRAILDFVSEHPHIFTWLNLHTFGGVLIRPLGDKPDHKMDQTDLAIYRQVEQWAKEHTGYPTVSGFHEFLYEPETPLKGDLTEYAYHQLGCLAYVIELWDLFTQIGMPQPKPFVDIYTRLDRKDFQKLAIWDKEFNKGRVFKAWRKVKHPQLGEVEVGGLDTRVGISNPPYEMLKEVCEKHSAAFLRVASLVPRVDLEVLSQEKAGPNLTKIEIRVVNRGYLGTYGLSSAKKLPHSEPLRLTSECAGVCITAPAESVVEIGHLDGWGQGLYHGVNIFRPWTRGNVHEKFVTLVAEGSGSLKVKVGSGRVGFKTFEIEI